MTFEMFREAVRKDGWVIVRKDGYIYFKRRDTSRADNQGSLYSCHTKDTEKAMETIKQWIVGGFPKTRAEKKVDMLFSDFLYSVWNLESDYFRNAELEGRHMTKSYIEQSRRFVRVYVEDFFKGIRVSKVNENLLNKYFDWLYACKSKHTGRPLARSSIARIKECLLTALKWGRRKGIVEQPIDFLIVCPNISRKPVMARGILTPEETARLILHKWDSKKAYIAFCIAVNCGLRVGEIRALKMSSVGRGYLIVTNSFNDVDGLKSTKNGKSRIVPCPDDVLNLIAEYVSELPENERQSDCYLLSNDIYENQPLEKGYCIKRFYRAMRQCGIERVRTNPLTGQKEYICFHSLRHQTATRWVESGLDIRLIAQAMGHTLEMLEHYSDHFNINDTEKLRSGLLTSGALGVSEHAQI